jgi:GNAT superfamily N-acetyltransferase
VSIRARAASDMHALVEVAARVHVLDGYPAFLPDGDFHRFLTTPRPLAAWVAVVDGEVVGHVSLHAESHPQAMEVVRGAGIAGEVGVIARLLVHPAVRHRGLGARLLEHARTEAVARGLVPVLDVVASAQPAVRLYRARGWEEIGRCTLARPDGPPIEELVFSVPRVGGPKEGRD